MYEVVITMTTLEQQQQQRLSISFDDMREAVKAKETERDERIVSRWLEILTLDYVREKIEGAMIDRNTTVVLLSEGIDAKERYVDHTHLMTDRIGIHKESVKESILYYVNNDKKYSIYWQSVADGKAFEISLTWFDLDEYYTQLHNTAGIPGCALCNVLCCLMCCVCCCCHK